MISRTPVDGEEEEPTWPSEPAPLRSPFVPLLLLSLVIAGWFTFQTTQLMRERESLQATRVGQEKSVQDSTKLRTSLEAIVRETATLAANGNASARLIVDELRKRGLAISPNAPPGSPSPK